MQVITDIEAMYKLKEGVLMASQYGAWRHRFDMDTAKGLTPDACRNLVLFVAREMFPARRVEVQYEYCFLSGAVAFFIDIYLT